MIADSLAAFVDPALAQYQSLSTAGAWLAMLGYTFQLYFDFSGYSTMAVGLGYMFGLRIPQNFNSPYKALDPADFWRRWHISLSTCMRDYLYIPFGGNRGSTAETYRNLMLTMLIGGLWHGAAWTFVFWGGYHGVLLALHRANGGSTGTACREPSARRAMFLAAADRLGVLPLDELRHGAAPAAEDVHARGRGACRHNCRSCYWPSRSRRSGRCGVRTPSSSSTSGAGPGAWRSPRPSAWPWR